MMRTELTNVIHAMVQEEMIFVSDVIEMTELFCEKGEDACIDEIHEIKGACQHTHLKTPFYNKAIDALYIAKY